MSHAPEATHMWEIEMKDRATLMEAQIEMKHPDLLGLARTYNNEAMQARKLIDSDLLMLKKGAKILEVGAGCLALSVQLASEGFAVTAVEPVGFGFSPLTSFISEYRLFIENESLEVNFINSKIEDFKTHDNFDYSFSINVLEHVDDPKSVINHVVYLCPIKFRIYCPNYNFPYEPHFAKFLLLRKNKAFFLKEKRARGSDLSDPKRLYDSINFITFKHIRLICKTEGLEFHPHKDVNLDLINRALDDSFLVSRHRLFGRVVNLLVLLKLNKIFAFLPLNISPLIDVTVSKNDFK